MKIENPDSILTVKIIEWRKLIDYFCQSIETIASRAEKKTIYFVRTGYIPSPSYGHPHI